MEHGQHLSEVKQAIGWTEWMRELWLGKGSDVRRGSEDLKTGTFGIPEAQFGRGRASSTDEETQSK